MTLVVVRATSIFLVLFLVAFAGCAELDEGATTIQGSAASPPSVEEGLVHVTRPVRTFADPSVDVWFDIDDNIDHLTRSFSMSNHPWAEFEEAVLSIWVQGVDCGPEDAFLAKANNGTPVALYPCRQAGPHWVNITFPEGEVDHGLNHVTLWQASQDPAHIQVRTGMVSQDATTYAEYGSSGKYAYNAFWALSRIPDRQSHPGFDNGILESFTRLDTDDDRVTLRVAAPREGRQITNLMLYGRHFDCSLDADGQPLPSSESFEVRLQTAPVPVVLATFDPCIEAKGDFDWFPVPFEKPVDLQDVPSTGGLPAFIEFAVVDTSHWETANIMLGTNPGQHERAQVVKNGEVQDMVPMLRATYGDGPRDQS